MSDQLKDEFVKAIFDYIHLKEQQGCIFINHPQTFKGKLESLFHRLVHPNRPLIYEFPPFLKDIITEIRIAHGMNLIFGDHSVLLYNIDRDFEFIAPFTVTREEDWMRGKKKLTLRQKIRKWLFEHDLILLSVDDWNTLYSDTEKAQAGWLNCHYCGIANSTVKYNDQFCQYLCADCLQFEREQKDWELRDISIGYPSHPPPEWDEYRE